MMDQLSSETLQIVFSNIALPELLKSQTLVCKRWNDVISDVNYLPFKKQYYRIINNDQDTINECKQSIEEKLQTVPPVFPNDWNLVAKNAKLEKCIPYLLNLVSSHPRLADLRIPHQALENLHRHRR